MTTVTLPREPIKHWAERYGDFPTAPKVMQAMQAEINELRAALDAPANPVDCMTCEHHQNASRDFDYEPYCALNCTDFDKFQALPPVVLTKVTK